ncbi:PP2C family protein-serine/threonine phosphatase [Calidifontibacillus oryziterrae]|uniref:PP2C family protein-serine/threonine phosphatase n=1 Tax=Calidifontibacillus oryziterrae TaxID=1191699 RepID=UPI0002FC12CB|nr:fused response regulator/phosphatase [Calidifontibacillus oryziterrae]
MTILIVDDSTDDRNHIVNLLQKHRLTNIFLFASGVDVITYIVKNLTTEEPEEIELIIMDIDLPDMNGIEACKKIKSYPMMKDTPVIITTKCRDSEIILASFNAGATDYIAKPINNVELIARVNLSFKLRREIDDRKRNELKVMNLFQKMQSDIQIAKQIQISILPSPLKLPHISIDARYLPSEQLSGDMYYWVEISPRKYGLILIDVMGHGIHASLISMSIRSLLHGLLTRVEDPVIIFKELNKHSHNLFKNSTKGHLNSYYFSGICMLFDFANKRIEYVNAGHPPALLLTDNKQIQKLEIGCPPIGLIRNLQFEKGVIPIKNSSRILLYTDGLTELSNHKFWNSRLQELFIKHQSLDHQSFFDEVLLERAKESTCEDDVCIISVKFNPNK